MGMPSLALARSRYLLSSRRLGEALLPVLPGPEARGWIELHGARWKGLGSLFVWDPRLDGPHSTGITGNLPQPSSLLGSRIEHQVMRTCRPDGGFALLRRGAEITRTSPALKSQATPSGRGSGSGTKNDTHNAPWPPSLACTAPVSCLARRPSLGMAQWKRAISVGQACWVSWRGIAAGQSPREGWDRLDWIPAHPLPLCM